MAASLVARRLMSGIAITQPIRPVAVSAVRPMAATAIGIRHLFAHSGAYPATPDEALKYLKEGNGRFVAGKSASPNRDLERVKSVAAGQKPFAAFLACADSRVPVEIIFDQGFGDVFVTRVAGNIATPELIGSLEFGTAVLGAKVLMVLGHTACGAVAATAKGGDVPGVISSLYYHIKPAVRACGGAVEPSIEENVRVQARQLAEVSPVLAGLIKEGKLKIVGGVYDLATGTVKEIAL
mmetsp:Transcript_21489/g.36853  ORF Transcript_21489/g.36853 Transcript_21489/m.36853 type:complete len:238 (+) Transcript_21489:128-841(+)|eukprot:CAMPEP_0196653120 /NCGR_PEP_ID=MMETSP1086-20130531/2698_1 /TAXON_ID=77921 /ORGANISM="Cyanoptyche  gloeocystis , Strain SAG4.97" /LENGTH=237 /DNA_ID=CAMNT_0041984139 /DNA_START=100 /DNA_END=813 /DNA_ORIENTATION=+